MRRHVVPIVAALIVAAAVILAASFVGRTSAAPSAMPMPHPTVTDFQFISAGATPPTNADCEAVARTCFTPQAIQSAYNVGPLYAHDPSYDGTGTTIAIVDSWGSDTMAHDLHVFNNAFGLPCGTCAARRA